MAEKADLSQVLHRLKRETPFKPFDVVTRTGARHPVAGRFHFAYNHDYVALLDDKGIPIHVDYGDISAIDTGIDQASGR